MIFVDGLSENCGLECIVVSYYFYIQESHLIGCRILP